MLNSIFYITVNERNYNTNYQQFKTDFRTEKAPHYFLLHQTDYPFAVQNRK